VTSTIHSATADGRIPIPFRRHKFANCCFCCAKCRNGKPREVANYLQTPYRPNYILYCSKSF